jgi:hypothetical protein
MRVRGFFALMVVSGGSWAVSGQNTPPKPRPVAPQSTEQPDPAQLPVTPVQRRDQEIREFDPLDTSEEDGKKPSNSDRDSGKASQRDDAPIPGSIAATEKENAPRPSGPRVDGDSNNGSDAPVQEYTGPAVLSRSYAVNRPLIPQQLKWQESAGVSSIYDTGLNRSLPSGVRSGNDGGAAGAQLTWSFVGRHYFRRDQVGVDYHGDYSHYNGGVYDGMNNSMTMDYTHVLSRRVSLSLAGTGSIFAQNYVLQNPSIGPDTSVANINLASSPNIQIFDNGTRQFTSQADITFQKTSRLSFNFGGAYFGISRDSPQLLGVSGRQAHGDVTYRLTRKTTIGASYSFGWYLYPHGAGNSNTNTYGLIYSYALNRTLQFRLRAGISNIESLGLQSVPIDPAVAALIGVSTGIIDAYHTNRTSDISAQIIKDFRRNRTATIAFAQGVSPGNGLFQTSKQQSISARFSAKLFRVWSLEMGVGRDSLSAVTQSLGKYQSESARIGFSRTYRRGLTLDFAGDFRHFDVGNLNSALRNQLRVTSGVTWRPGEGRLWPF